MARRSYSPEAEKVTAPVTILSENRGECGWEECENSPARPRAAYKGARVSGAVGPQIETAGSGMGHQGVGFLINSELEWGIKEGKWWEGFDGVYGFDSGRFGKGRGSREA